MGALSHLGIVGKNKQTLFSAWFNTFQKFALQVKIFSEQHMTQNEMKFSIPSRETFVAVPTTLLS